jgi:Protein of unknown function (DUF3551)
MPKLLAALRAVAMVVALAPMAAAARDFPFCIKGCDFAGSRGDCTFVSYQQCQATASGRDAYCGVNPYFNASADSQGGRAPQSRRKF